MIKYLLLGWDLELYGIHEAHYIYCYLEYLFSWLRQTIICGQDQVSANTFITIFIFTSLFSQWQIHYTHFIHCLPGYMVNSGYSALYKCVLTDASRRD